MNNSHPHGYIRVKYGDHYIDTMNITTEYYVNNKQLHLNATYKSFEQYHFDIFTNIHSDLDIFNNCVHICIENATDIQFMHLFTKLKTLTINKSINNITCGNIPSTIQTIDLKDCNMISKNFLDGMSELTNLKSIYLNIYDLCFDDVSLLHYHKNIEYIEDVTPFENIKSLEEIKLLTSMSEAVYDITLNPDDITFIKNCPILKNVKHRINHISLNIDSYFDVCMYYICIQLDVI